MKKLFFFALVILQFANTVLAQNKKLDSLVASLANQTDTNRVITLNKITLNYWNSKPDLAKKYGLESIQLAKKLNFNYGEIAALNVTGVAYDILGDKDSAVVLYQEALLKNFETKREKTLKASLHNNLGMIFSAKGDKNKALEYYIKAAELFGEVDSKTFQANAYENIGLIFNTLKIENKVKDYFNKALAIRLAQENKYGLSQSYLNYGLFYANKKMTDTAIVFYEKSKAIKEAIDDRVGLGFVYNNLGINYRDVGKVKESISAYLKAIGYRKQFNDYQNLSGTYTNIAFVYYTLKEVKTGILFLDSAVIYAELSKSPEKLELTYRDRGIFQAEIKNYEAAFNDLKKSFVYADTLKQLAITNSLTEMESKFNLKEKENEIKLKDAEVINERTQKYAFITIALALIVSLIVLIFYFRNKQKTKRIIEVQKERERIARELHDNIGSQLTYLINSIDDFSDSSLNQKEELENLGIYARNTIQDLRQTIWAMNKKKVSLLELQTKLNDYLTQNLNFPSAPKFELNLLSEKHFEFGPVQALNIFRIVQETINNALKHGQANQIKLDISYLNQQVNFKISDNGKGFETNTSFDGHFGLQNMQKRAQEINAEFNLESAPGKGTTVTLIVGKQKNLVLQ